MTRVAILGASGYTARELIRILLRHSEARITVLTSRQDERPHVAELHPSLRGLVDLRCEPFVASEVAERVECVFSALPHTASMTAVAELLERGCRVIDLSADYRLPTPELYQEWYQAPHTNPGHLKEAVYGLPELYADRIAKARLVANPGCYPVAGILALAPLLAGGWIEPAGIAIDAKSGVSGAGRSPTPATHFPECNESVTAYNAGRHRHTPEIDHVLSQLAARPVEVLFVPHLIPMDQGILATVYARPAKAASEADLLQALRIYYEGKPFVRVVTHLPGTKDCVGTNFCDLTVRLVRGRVVIFSAIDNLIKGASGLAVQNFNLMFGFSETAALL